MPAVFDKTVKFLGETENPAACDILRVLLDSQDWPTRSAAFEALYLKKDQTLNLLLLSKFLEDEENWMKVPAVNTDRLARLFEAATRANDPALLTTSIQMVLRWKIYDGLKSLLPFLDSPRADLAKLAGESILSLAEKFYDEMAACTTVAELRNLDRRREWFSAELEDAVRRYSVHGMVEPIKAFLLVARKDYASFLNIMGDHHSAASKKILELIETGDHGSYLRLLLSFLEDSNAPPQIDAIICKRSDARFVRNMLSIAGQAQNAQAKQPYKRFKDFAWMKPNDPHLPELIESEEASFVQLFTNIGLTREKQIEMFRFVFSKCSAEGRRAAAESLRAFPGDDFNALLLDVVNDPDPAACATLMKLVKSRNMKEAEQVIGQCLERSEPQIMQAIYDIVPDYHIESYLQKVVDLDPQEALTRGRIVRKVDENAEKVLSAELVSAVPVRRIAAITAVRYMGFGREYQDYLIKMVREDAETTIRVAACTALGEVLTVESLRTLKEATEERSLALRTAATEAIQRWSQLYAQSKRG
ncbi:MAG: hypothetical protein ACRC10_04965 [Thermoguttaceae bacterium]